MEEEATNDLGERKRGTLNQALRPSGSDDLMK
jgi:hypothetical protein